MLKYSCQLAHTERELYLSGISPPFLEERLLSPLLSCTKCSAGEGDSSGNAMIWILMFSLALFLDHLVFTPFGQQAMQYWWPPHFSAALNLSCVCEQSCQVVETMAGTSHQWGSLHFSISFSGFVSSSLCQQCISYYFTCLTNLIKTSDFT